MNIVQRLSLLYRRFSPLEERLLAAVCEVLPQKARSIFEAQVAGITLVQRLPQWTEIDLYRKQHGKVDWSDVPAFPRTGEFKLAEVKFSVGGRGYKATLTSISGHIFDITVTPSPKAIAFADWDAAPAVGLLSDPLTVTSASEPSPIPELWRQFLTRHQAPARSNWTFYNSETAVRTAIADA